MFRFSPRFELPVKDESSEKKSMNIVCHYCNQPGHKASGCPSNPHKENYKVGENVVNGYLSSACLVAHKASTEFLHLFLSAAVTHASSHELHPASLLSFSTVRLQVVFGRVFFLLPSGAHVIAMLLWLFLSCLRMWPIIFHLRCFTSTLSGFVSAFSCNSSVVTCSSQRIRRICLRHLF